MKKEKHHMDKLEKNSVKRKSEDRDYGASKLKRKKKNITPTNCKKVQDITVSPKNQIGEKIRQGGRKIMFTSKGSPKESEGSILKKASSTAESKGDAQRSPKSLQINKKRRKQQVFSVSNKVPPAAEGSAGALPVTSDGLKKKAKAHKTSQNLSKHESLLSNTSKGASECNFDVMKKKKLKKTKRDEGTMIVSSTVDNTDSSSPSKSLQKKTKNKPGNKLFSEEKGLFVRGQGPIQLNPSKVSVNNDKSKLGQKKGKGSDNVEKHSLKGKDLKRHARKLRKTISKLKDFKNKQTALLPKAGTELKKRKIQFQICKLQKKINKLERDLSASGFSGTNTSEVINDKGTTKGLPKDPPSRTNTIEVINHRVYKGLPENPPSTVKKQQQVGLKDYLQNQMRASRFRWLNENLYTSSSEDAQHFFKEDPESFKAYHEGYSEQVAKWPVKPVDVIIKELKSLPKDTVVADLGCGEAKLAVGLPHLKVYSLDFIALKPEVIACDMAHCPLLRSSVDVAVFCLSLMGTNVSDFLLEANRILKLGGMMEIAEVESRFESIDDFIGKVHKYGFQLIKKSPTDMFFFLTFKKKQDVVKSGKLPEFALKACVYKKR